MNMLGRVAVITGAAGQIGSAVARMLAKNGADLCLIDSRPATALAHEIKTLGRRVINRSFDIRDSRSICATVAETVSIFGRLDILVNVAGIARFGSAEALSEAQWDEVIDINLKGSFLWCQAVIAPMRDNKHGRIINIGSVLGKNGGNARPWIDRSEQTRSGNVAYGVSKAGVHAMTVYLARELAADGITVNAVAPGPVASPLTTNFPEVR